MFTNFFKYKISYLHIYEFYASFSCQKNLTINIAAHHSYGVKRVFTFWHMCTLILFFLFIQTWYTHLLKYIFLHRISILDVLDEKNILETTFQNMVFLQFHDTVNKSLPIFNFPNVILILSIGIRFLVLADILISPLYL